MKYKHIAFTVASLILIFGLSAPQQAFTADFSTQGRSSFDKENELGFFGLTSVKLGYSHVMSSISLENIPLPINYNFDKTDKGTFVIGVAGTLGYKFTPLFGIRTELEFLLRTENRMKADFVATTPAGIQKGVAEYNVTIGTLLTNVYFDFYVTKQIALYTGVGLGLGLLEQSAPGSPDDDFGGITFAWNVSAGTMINIWKSLVLDIGIRYSDFGRIDNGSEILLSKNKLQAVEVLAGISYKF